MDRRWELTRSAASAAVLIELGREYGVAADQLLTGTGITAELLSDPVNEISAAQEIELAKNLVTALGQVPGLGLRAGLKYQIATHGLWGFALTTSPTVRDALTIIAAYPELSYSFSRITVESRADSVALVFDDHDVPAEIRVFNTERDWGILVNLARAYLPDAIPFTDLSVTRQAPPHAHLYPELLGVTPRFGSPRDELVIPNTLVDLPMPQANPAVAAAFTAQAAQLLNRRRERLGIAGAVRHELLRTRRFTTDQDEVARSLNLSVRTLRRRLADEGTSYREIVGETARLLAEELLASGLTVSDVAHRLGYSGAPAFTDAFRSWNGTTPGAFARSSTHTTRR
ncbi:AraC family transcriptional regulator [Smaragdicoccus niigatensis]|uniref:AraC family transcriptional regulator n=1 Tax=Smaragdicoccus niigatensis TaxID=359359 RepID=UPI0003609919|nr:AraC family transcriptional regulator [Smaragdicoccus niigatensis]